MNKVTVTNKAYLARKEKAAAEKESNESILLKPDRKGDTVKWVNYNKKIKKV